MSPACSVNVRILPLTMAAYAAAASLKKYIIFSCVTDDQVSDGY